MRRRLGLALLITLALVWHAALLAAPLAPIPSVAAATYAAGSIVCHQRPERSFHLAGAQLPVCARCFGLYVGAAAGILAWLLAAGTAVTPRVRAQRLLQPRIARKLLGAAALPTLLTVGAAALGVWDDSNVVRALLAVPFGAVIAAVTTAVACGDLR